jgi:dienelactone hydrolase
MTDELRLSGYREPLGLWVHDAPRPSAHPTLRLEDLEFSSRGDRVPGRVVLPADGAGPLPLVLFQGGRGGAARERALEALGAAWAGRGAAVASIDLPLEGVRADAKLAGWLPAPGDAAASPLAAALAREVARQAVIDLERALDALGSRAWIDAERIAFVGLGAGARIGSAFCALDPRVRAAALDAAAAETPAAGLDPAAHLARIAPRPLLRIEPGELPDDGEPPDARLERRIWDFVAGVFGL